MSEAVSSNHDPDFSRVPEANKAEGRSVNLENPAPQPDDIESSDRWQVVEFPDAMSLAELSNPSILKPDLRSEADQPDLGNLVRQLQQENVTFCTQIKQLERDLAQAQIDLQLEVARFYCKESETVAVPVPDSPSSHALNAIHRQISQLSQELEDSQQMGHRQQILVETLSEQLESSQERIAHLERDCAITQQRYNEQVQLVLQAENICRDLRMRLHRQQRQALQFKAALEKSLEMGTVQGVAIAQIDLTSSGASHSAMPFIPKVQSVQPWSQEVAADLPAYGSCRGESDVLPNLLSKLLKTEQPAAVNEVDEITSIQEVVLPAIQLYTAVEPEQSKVKAVEVLAESVSPSEAPPIAQASASSELMTPEEVSQYIGLIFSKQSSQSASSTDASASQAVVVDLSPCLEGDQTDSSKTDAINPVPDIEIRPIAKTILPPLLRPPTTSNPLKPSPVQAASLPVEQEPVEQAPVKQKPEELGDREDTLWADLARLIEPDLVVEESSPSDLASRSVEQGTPVEQVATNPFQSVSHLSSPDLSSPEETAPKSIAKEHKSDRASAAKPLSLEFFAYIEKKAPTSLPTPQAAQEAVHSEPKPKVNPESKSEKPNSSRFQKKPAKSAKPSKLPKPGRVESVESVEPKELSLPKPVETMPDGCPSPILYPFRPAKKLNSMAAVDLPSFR
jgi:hypothetical protein